jgi:small redox-active disulfide protein 2
MKIEILGMGCPKCKKASKNVWTAVNETGVTAEVCEIKNAQKIADYGVMMTPAVVIDGEVKCKGKIPKVGEIKD